MRWSFRIARIAGIDVRVHATFLLLLGAIAYLYGVHGTPGAAVWAVLFWLALFLCVLLHEFGHALAARAYGIKTVDITLLPIGGIARMERMPEKPIQELIVAVAGPLVNLVISIGLALTLLLFASGDLQPRVLLDPLRPNLLVNLLILNIAMMLFNLIPAFPMDGGRILRALLATRLEYARATQIAATIGQGLALAFGIIGAFQWNFLWVLLAIFVYTGAETEATFVQMRYATAGLPVSSAMVTRFETLNQNATLNQAVDALLGTSQHEFPVLDDNGGFAGLLTKHDLLLALRQSGPETPVAEVMIKGLPTVLPQTNFQRAFDLMQSSKAPAIPVVDQAGRLVGLFTTENVGELLMIQSALKKGPRRFRA
jgi:Zn-dependent protease/CBS domain-containing protein